MDSPLVRSALSPVSQHSVLSAEGQATAIAESILASPKGFHGAGKYRFTKAAVEPVEVATPPSEHAHEAELEQALDDLKLSGVLGLLARSLRSRARRVQTRRRPASR